MSENHNVENRKTRESTSEQLSKLINPIKSDELQALISNAKDTIKEEKSHTSNNKGNCINDLQQGSLLAMYCPMLKLL